jgi:hypothetical protein
MRSLSDLIRESSQRPPAHGGVVLAGFAILVILALGMPAAVVWMASSLASGSTSYVAMQ